MDFLVNIFIFCIVLSNFIEGESIKTLNVVDFGAVGDGKTDDTQAFLKAWDELCGSFEQATLIIPGAKSFLLQATKFNGPCKSTNLKIQIFGQVIAPESIEAWKSPQFTYWLCFDQIYGLVITGSGQFSGFDGRGYSWWPMNREKPAAIHLNSCTNVYLTAFTIRNSPRAHIAINGCGAIGVYYINIQAPSNSHNTDGIDIASSKNVIIKHSWIQTGDDCIAINGQSYDIHIDHVNCGPGHGISVGSLGKEGAHDIVDGVYVTNCILNGTMNGARIKTFQNGLGYARNILFQELTMINTNNPIIIDQQYVSNPGYQPEAVQVYTVNFTSIHGTSSCEKAIQLDCPGGCSNIIMNNVNLYPSDPKKYVYAYCNNAHGTATSTTPKVACLSQG